MSQSFATKCWFSKVDLSKNSKKAIKLGGEIEFDYDAERSAMFDHVWNRTNNIFYHSMNRLKVHFIFYLNNTKE